MKTLFNIPTLSYLRSFLDKPKEPTIVEVASLLEELKALSEKIDIELPGVQRYTFAKVTFEDRSTLEISKSKLLLVETPTAKSRPGKAFWSVRTKPAKITTDGEVVVDAKFELEEALFRIDNDMLQTLITASKQGTSALEKVLAEQYESRMSLRKTESNVINMVREVLRCNIDRYHPYVHWTLEAIKERSPDMSDEAVILAGISKKFKDIYSQLHVSHYAFSEPRYHTIVKRKIEEGARQAWRNHLVQKDSACSIDPALSAEKSILHELTGFLFKPSVITPENIKGAFEELKMLSPDGPIYIPGDAYTDVGEVHFPDKHSAQLKLHAGNMYVELKEKSKYVDVIPADVYDDGRILGTSKSLATEYLFELTPSTMKSLLAAHAKGGSALSDWVRTQQVILSDETPQSPSM